ncbi:unnamed protein product, partial [Ixodes hexagonus]
KVFGEDYASLARDVGLVLVVTLVVTVLCFNKWTYAPNKSLPPGPRGIPVLGYLPFLGSSLQVTFKKLADTYGPIVRVRLGSKDVVVLNDLDTIKEGLNTDEVLSRPTDFLLRSVGVDGIVTMNGQPWVDNRRFCMHVLRDLGFGKKSMEEHIKEEIAQLCDYLNSWNCGAGPLSDVLTSSVSNNITALVFGERYPRDDPRRQFLDRGAIRLSRNARFISALDFLPALRRLVSCIPSSRSSIVKNQAGSQATLIFTSRKEVDERSRTLKADVNRDFIDAYLKKINESNGTNPSFNLRTLTGNALNLFGAGTNTVRASLEWHLLNCARDPEGVQKKLQKEVDDVVGRHRAPEWEDRHRMPYTMAVIWEMLRWRTTTPLGVIRAAQGDTNIGGFHIPAGTVVLANFWAVHHDPEIWAESLEFDPTRFLNADQTELLPKPAAFMPFSTGRRMCPGETLALMEIFMYLTTLLQKFTVLPKRGETISMDVHDGLTSSPLHSQELRFVFHNGHTTSTMTAILVLVIILVLSVLLLKKRNSKASENDKVMAPGPNGLPILGYLPFMGRLPHVTYKKLSETYGPIVRVKLGSVDVCVLHTVESIKEGLNNDEVLARPSYFLLRDIGIDGKYTEIQRKNLGTTNLIQRYTRLPGIISMNGQPWADNRRFCLHVLRNLGFGKKSMEEHIREEIAQLCDVLRSWSGKPKLVTDVLTSSISNNITALIFGERFHYDDPRRHFLDERAVKFALNATFVSALDFLPTVRKLVSYFPSTKARLAKKQVHSVIDFIRQEMGERSKTLDEDVNRDFIDAYLKKINENNGGNASFNLRTLTGNAVNIFGAGTNTVRASMEWHLLNCARDPEGVQRKLQQEVDNVVGRVRAPEWEDRLRMPYTMAVIWEMQRWRTLAALGITRVAERDTKIGGFHIPAGTVVLPNVWAVHHDPELWENPEEFDPTRFLSADHTELLPKPTSFMPFSTGRRMCPGETLAMMEMFLYLATLMQKFTVLPKDVATISMDIHDALIAVPLCQEIRFLPR